MSVCTYYWLVEEFDLAPHGTGNSTGRYMKDMVELTTTTDVYAARRFRLKLSAEFRAQDMIDRHGGHWRATEHGFMPLYPNYLGEVNDITPKCSEGGERTD